MRAAVDMWPDLVFPPINLYSYPRTGELTPCVKLCKLEGGECTGCGRTLDQIKYWREYDTAEKLRIIEDIHSRRAPHDQ